ncbi:MAG: hypothetical protein QOI24_2640 [Acidobacteriota bacterium]|nr:hypothetical protein [Acidobacteriota bacterium]
MKRGHLDHETIAVYINEPEALENLEAVEEHLRECVACGEIVASVQALEAQFDHPETWASQRLAELPQRPPQHLVEHAERLRVENALAEYLLRPLLKNEETFQHSSIATDRRYYTAGVVRCLVHAAEEIRDRQLRFALHVTAAAVIIAEQLTPPAYGLDDIHTAIGQAWREHANVLRFTGDYRAALHAIDRARDAFQLTNLNTFDLARVALVRGTVLWKMERFGEALPLAEESAAGFLEFNDTERWIHAGLLKGGILFDTQRYEEAVTVFQKLLVPAETLDIGPTLGLVYNGLGAALQEVEEVVRAAEFFQKALALYDHFGMVLERTRTAWSLARLAIRQGHRANGMLRLRAALDMFLAHGSMSDAGLVALYLAEELLREGRITEVLKLCEDLGDRFTAAGLETRAAAAVRFMQIATSRGVATPKVFEHARRYFRRLSEQPELPFIEPPADDEA